MTTARVDLNVGAMCHGVCDFDAAKFRGAHRTTQLAITYDCHYYFKAPPQYILTHAASIHVYVGVYLCMREGPLGSM